MPLSRGFWSALAGLTGLTLLLTGQPADSAETHVRILLTNPGGADRSLGIRPLAEDYRDIVWGSDPGAGHEALSRMFSVLTTGPVPEQLLTEREAALWRLYRAPTETPEQQRYRQRMIENLFAVRYLLADPDTGAAMVSAAPQAYLLLLKMGEPLGLVAIEKRFYLPRVYFRTDIVPVASFRAFLNLLDQPGKLKPFQQVAIENPQHSSVSTAVKDVAIHQLSDGELLVKAPQAGYLVLADALTDRSKANVNGQSVEIEIANGYQQAIWLETGEHHIVFSQ